MKSLSLIVWETIHRSEKSIPQLADEIGCSESLLYKAANINDPVDIKLAWLIPLMSATGDFSILRHLALRLGFILVKIPRSRRLKPEDVAEHQRVLNDHVRALLDYMDGRIEKDEALEKTEDALIAVAGARKRIESDGPQGELFEEEGNGKTRKTKRR